MKSVESSRKRGKPVEGRELSTGWTHRTNALWLRDRAVFPVVHTPYDYYERI